MWLHRSMTSAFIMTDDSASMGEVMRLSWMIVLGRSGYSTRET